jgi:hypothetical protein
VAETTHLSLRIPADLLAELDARAGEERGEGRPSTLLRDLGRYYGILRDALGGIRLDEAEASLLCDALNGCYLDDYASPVTPSRARATLISEVEDHIRLNAADETWSVDARLLRSKLLAWSPIECLAVWDACARFWRYPERAAAEMLREVGLVRDRPTRGRARVGRSSPT